MLKERNGYPFSHWQYLGTDNTYYIFDFGRERIYQDMEIIAVWKKEFVTVTFIRDEKDSSKNIIKT